MFKRTIKLRIHNPKCDIRNRKFGNMTDLCINGDWTLYGPTFQTNALGIPVKEAVKFYSQLVGLGVSMTLPKWYGARILPRSGTWSKFKVILANEEGVIEASYCKEWLANLIH
jgi:hypothetical protein